MFLPLDAVNMALGPGTWLLQPQLGQRGFSAFLRKVGWNCILSITHMCREYIEMCMDKMERWNVHEATINEDPRTNNVSEAWNNKCAHMVGHQHPTVWKCIKVLQPRKKVRRAIMWVYDLLSKFYSKVTQKLSNVLADILLKKHVSGFIGARGRTLFILKNSYKFINCKVCIEI